MKKAEKKNELVIFKTKTGGVELRGDFSGDTIWASLDQIATVFGRDKSVISRHLSNIFKENELNKKATVAKIATVQTEGKRSVERDIEYYNLDAILSVGYRVNSKQATSFRIWATKTLKEHLLKGYTVNEKRLKENTTAKLAELEKTIALITGVKNKQLSQDETAGLLTVIQQYTDTWSTLLAYDEGRLKAKLSKKKGRIEPIERTYTEVATFKEKLLKSGEASELFARERNKEALAGILGNISQSFGGKQVYASVEEKAAHILYFVVKNHPFTDGNKRTGAFLFLRFLDKNNHLMDKKGQPKINQAALTALTLLVAESNPKEKEVMIALITQLIS